MSDSNNFLIYGSYGYTGELVVELALQRGFKPVLAGRNGKRVKAQAEQAGLPFKVFSLDSAGEIAEGIRGFAAVLHCAGPFSQTAKPMAQACLKEKVHYVDLTGEIEVFELMASLGTKAKEAGIMLLPGAGFDVVPSDCLSARLKEQMPDAQNLELVIYSKGGRSSHGTAKTAVESLGYGSLVRKNGKITKVPMAWKVLKVELDGNTWKAPCIPWGDVSTAYHSTGIPNVMTCMVFPDKMVRLIKMSRYLGFILRSKWVKKKMTQRILKQPKGPNEQERSKAISIVWGRVTDSKGKQFEATLTSPNGYSLTADTSLLIIDKILKGNAPVGFQTPSSAYGSGLILEAAGTHFDGF